MFNKFRNKTGTCVYLDVRPDDERNTGFETS